MFRFFIFLKCIQAHKAVFLLLFFCSLCALFFFEHRTEKNCLLYDKNHFLIKKKINHWGKEKKMERGKNKIYFSGHEN